MKKYLLFIISMLCVSIGTWAEPTYFGASGTSTWELTGDSPNKTLTLTFNNANDKPSNSWAALCDISGVKKVVVITGSGVTLSGGQETALAELNDYYKTIPLLDLSAASINIVETYGGSGIYTIPMAGGDNSTFNNIIVPSSYTNGLNILKVSNRWSWGAYATLNTYQVSDNTISAVFKTDKSNYATLTDIKSDYVTLKLAADVTDAIDLSTVLPAGKTLDLTAVTTVATSSNDITVLSAADPKINVICLIDGVKSRVKPVESCNFPDISTVITGTISEIKTHVEELASYGLCLEEANVTGELSTADLTYLGNINGLKRLNLQEATLATGVELNSLAIPSTLEVLVLPKKASDTKSSVTDAMKTHANLKYIYAPFSGTQDKDQMVADYVWVNKPGGLSKAFDEQTRLLSAWYMIVESTVALNDDDVNFWGSGSTARPMQYRYLDLSGANITPAVLANYKVTDNLPYRIILPNDWTGDMMAVFAANSNKGSIAAVYSYTGTDHKRLDILELNDYAYLPTALSDSRIVRSGTTSIRVVSGHYGNNPVYSKFGDNLLTAINGAASSITSVTIAVGSGIYESVDNDSDPEDDIDQAINTDTEFAFANTNLTDLTLSFLNNEYVTFDIHGCSKLQNLTANETKLKSIVANGITTLTKVDMGHAIIGGDVNYSGCTALASLEPGKDEIGGTLNISNTAITSLDLSDVTVMSVNASNTNSLTTLNLKGITLSGMGSTPDEILQANIDGRIGTVEITRSGGDYSGISIEVGEESDFDHDRIVPNPTASADKYNNCESDFESAHATWETNFGNWLYDNKATYLSNELEAQLRYYYQNELDAEDQAEYGSEDNYVKYRMTQGDLGVGNAYNDNFTNWLYTNKSSYLSTTKEDELNTDYTTNWTSTFDSFEEYLKSDYLLNNIDLDGNGNPVDNEAAVAAAKTAYAATSGWTTDPSVMFNNAKTDFASSGAEGAGAEPNDEDCTPTSYALVTTPDAHVEITVAGNDLQTHIGEATYMDGDEPTSAPAASAIEILHVTETLTSADINYIATMTGLKCLDLSGATYDSGLTFQNVLDAGLRITTAIILPKTGSSTTESGIEADMLAAMYAFQRANYECVGYYSKKESEDKNLNIYGYNSTVANLKTGNLSTQQGETQAKLIDNYTDIKFLRYYKDGEDITKTFDDGQDFPQATPSLLPALGTITADSNYPFTVDMTWLNISNLGNDFHNVDCRYLVIPQNSSAATVTRNDKLYNNDFTVEDDGNDVTNDYTYNARVYAVSTYKGNVAPYATNAYFGGDALWYDNGFGHKNTTACLMYLRQNGHLSDIADHMDDMNNAAHIISIVGTINADEIAGLNKLQNKCIDLTRATIASNSVLESLDNDYVESISIPYYSVTNLEAIPANDVKGLSDLPTLSKTACTNLKGVGMLVKSNDIASGSSKKGRLIYKSYEEGGMANQMLMLHALNQVNREYVISRMVLGGPVNARDISVRDNGIDMNGHLATIVTDGKMTAEATTFWDAENGNQIYGTLNGYANIEWWDFSKVTLPTYTSVGAQGYKKIPNSSDWEFDEDVDYAFDNDTHSYAAAKASGSSYSYQNDLCYTELGIAPATSMMDEPKLPTDPSVWRLVDHALDNCHLLQNICLPWNYQYLGDGALWGTILQHITTTDANGHLIDNGDNTYTLSANLKELGNKPSGAKDFVSACVFPQNRPVYDCYALATTTPKCYRGVFPANMYYGWGGFQGAGFPYCREKYKNGSNWFTVLRFPYRAAWEAAHPSPARQTDMEFEEDDDEPMADVQKAPASRRTQKGQVDPDASYDQMKMAYTDVTKNYTKKEQTGAVDANGDAILWPTFSELRRVYNQASHNVTWNNWDATYDINHDVIEGSGTIPLPASDADALGTYGNDYTTSSTEATEANTASPAGDPYKFEDYEGWHQFVLSQATYVKPGEEQVEIAYREYEKDASWYTFCIPFDMTEEDVIKLMGVPASTDKVKTTINTFGEHPEEEDSKYQQTALLPEIRTMKSVTRTPSTTTVNIYTSQDLGTGDYAKKFYKPAYGETPEEYESNGTVTIDGSTKDVMIRGGYPYLIKPWKLRGTTISSLGKDIMTRYQFRAEQSSIYHSTADCYDSFGSGDNKTGTFARPYENHKMQAVEDPGGAMNHTDTKHAEKPYNYTYVGQFWKQPLPLHCFYQNSKRLWRHYQNYDERYFWNPYTCIIMVTDEVRSDDETTADVTLKGGEFRDELNCQYPVAAAGLDSEGAYAFDKTLEVYYKNGLDDPFDTASARDYQFFFDEDIMDFDPDGQATAIEVLDGVRIAPVRGKVYNMAGQYVGNSLEGLSKGMYIVNGKKYVIK